MVPESQESPPHDRKAFWLDRKTKPSLCAETRGASSNQRQSHQTGAKLHIWTIKVSATRRVCSVDRCCVFSHGKLFFFLIPEVEPKQYLITDEFRKVIGVWKWGVLRKWRKSKWRRGEHFSPCLRTLIQNENHRQKSSSEYYYLC